MKKSRKHLISSSCLIAVMICLIGCSKDNPLNPLEDCGNGEWTSRVSKELNDWSVAASNYNADPTAANCSGFISAAKNYFDALEEVRGCVPGVNKQAFEQALEEVKTDLNDLDCSGS